MTSTGRAQNPTRSVQQSSLFRLASDTVVAAGNQFVCPIANTGYICAAPVPVRAGGVWPKGTTNQLIYDAGISVVGITPRASGCTDSIKVLSRVHDCFPWAGDTTGAVFQRNFNNATPVAGVFDSRSPSDLAGWPAEGSIPEFPFASAMVTDTSIFASSLIGRKAVSDQDTWTAYWDGDPAHNGGRKHPAGLFVEMRTMQWNQPRGSEATIFFVFRITNVTNNALFQQLQEETYFQGADRLPNEGWRFDSVYFAYTSDMDMSNAGNNYMTAIVPFNLFTTYVNSLYDQSLLYPPSEFHAPFYTNSPGFAATMFLKTPSQDAAGRDRGMTLMSQLTGGGAFPDVNNIAAWWRRYSVNLKPGVDASCNLGTLDQVRTGRVCWSSQTAADVRGWISSGPFTLQAGESKTFVMATIGAASVAMPTITPAPNLDLKPGLPTLAPGCFTQPVRTIEVIAGWLASTQCPNSTTEPLDMLSVSTVPGSLLGKAIVAKSMQMSKFVPAVQAPEAPVFYAVPGNNRITITWEPSATEELGDAYFETAGSQFSIFYDANYRQFDVEGYRIFRGTRPDELKLIAQFDKSGSVFVDALCITATTPSISACRDTLSIPLRGEFIQNTTVTESPHFIVAADTALAAELRAGDALPLSDTGIPFLYVDKDVRNGFRYYYKVVAFDINSIRSGPSSLVSASEIKVAQPRSDNVAFLPLYAVTVHGRTVLSPREAPSIDPVAGTFSGPQPPTMRIAADLTVIAPRLLKAGVTEVRIDSIVPAYYANGSLATYYISGAATSSAATFSSRMIQTIGGSPPITTESFETTIQLAVDSTELAGTDDTEGAPPYAAALNVRLEVERPHWSSTHEDWAYKMPNFWVSDPPNRAYAGGSRWFTGENESTPDPTLDVVRHGAINGVTIFQPVPYRAVASPSATPNAVAPAMAAFKGLNENLFRRFYGITFGLTRAADVKLYWGGAGLDSVVDVTHDVAVQYSPALRATYGFLGDGDADGKLVYGDFYYIPGIATAGATEIAAFSRDNPRPLSQQPVVLPVDVTGDLAPDGDGFGLYINGEPWLFQGAVPVNTVWTLRTYNGTVGRDAAGNYSFTYINGNPAVPGLRMILGITAPSARSSNAGLARVHTVPDPYYANSLFDSGSTGELQFVNLPPRATLRIYSLSGVLVRIIEHDDLTGGGTAKWDLTSRNGSRVATGVYMFHVSTPQGHEHIGRFTIVNSR